MIAGDQQHDLHRVLVLAQERVPARLGLRLGEAVRPVALQPLGRLRSLVRPRSGSTPSSRTASSRESTCQTCASLVAVDGVSVPAIPVSSFEARSARACSITNGSASRLRQDHAAVAGERSSPCGVSHRGQSPGRVMPRGAERIRVRPCDRDRPPLGVAHVRRAVRRRRGAPGRAHARAGAGERRALRARARQRRVDQGPRRTDRRQAPASASTTTGWSSGGRS